ncbi:ATP-binding protein [Duganella vulcania]|uniref:ATP-binding protein n=1 Tax=Duganella vulcania TaxID=2692166 RepID=A0A845GIV8_9BURK|nr:ATP-binding protein [Duganella vulcania]MYM93430.1 ATP-binding protein [Duganella vulcania]
MDRKETGIAQLLRFPARLDAVSGAMSFAAMALKQAGLGPGVVARAELILEELLRNSILHGHGGDSAHSVWVGVDGARLVYEDEAPAFNPFTQGPPPPDPALPIAARAVGGVGLLLIRQLGSAVAYQYSGGRNRIEIALQ